MSGQEEAADLADHLHSFAIHFLRLVRREDSASGVGPAQLSALSVLAYRDGITLGELARVEQVSLPTMSRIVAALQRSRLVARSVNPADRRAVSLSLTDRGQALFEAARTRRLRVASAVAASLDADERARLDPIIAKLDDAVSRQRRS